MANSILREIEQKLKQRDELNKLAANILLFFDKMKLPDHVEAQLDFYRRQYDGILNRIDEIPG